MKSQIKRSLAVSMAALCAVVAISGPTPALATDAWTPSQTIAAPGSAAGYPQITSSSDGTTLTAVWYRSNGANTIIQTASSTTSGTTWTAPTDLSAAGRSAFYPQIAGSSDGTKLTAVWERSDGTNNIIQTASSIDGGTTWTAPTDLSAAGRSAFYPQIAGSSDGTKLTAVWQRFDGTNFIIQTASSTTSGTTWTAPANLSLAGGSAQLSQITGSGDGTKLTAIWMRYDGTNFIIQTSSSTTSGTTWTAPTNLSAPGGNAERPQVTSNSDGTKLTAIWMRDDGTNFIIQTASSIDGGTTWSTPINLSAPGETANRPQITSSSDGTKLTATWQRSDGPNDIIQTASSIDGGTTWSTPINLSAPGATAQLSQITGSGDGTKLTAIWIRFNGSHHIVQAASSSDTGATWTAPSDLSTIGASGDRPQVTGSIDGVKTIAVWSRSTSGIQVSILQRSFASATSPSPVVSLYHASLDPNGGTCVTNGIATTTSARTPFLGYSYIPGAEECTRIGFTFQGWAATTKPDTVIPLPLLRGWDDGIWRYFIANSYDLIAVWKSST